MAGREITDRSSPEEIAAAQRELAEAQQQLQAWENQRVNDPRRVRAGQQAAPEHVEILRQDPYRIPGDPITSVGQPLSISDEVIINQALGVGYTVTERNQQMNRIAAQYDYVTVGDLGSSSTGAGVVRATIAGSAFFVPGLGTNSRDLTPRAPSTSLTPGSDAAIPTPPDTPSLESFVDPTVPELPGATNQTVVGSDLGARFPGAELPDDTAVPSGRFTQDQLDTTAQGVTITGTEVPVIGDTTSTDDSGAVDGTGVDAGVISTGLDEDLVDGGAETSDPDRGPSGPASEDGGDGIFFDLGDIPVTTSPDVDVSDLATPPRAGSGKSIEDNKPGVQLRPNVLHNYSNWTYNIGFYMLTPAQHASIVQNGTVRNPESELTNLLIRTGGVGSKGVLGDKRDYYIENFRFTSIMGQNSESSRSSNNFDISFEIVEPYGVAFLAELVQLALLQGVDDHFDIPYLLELKFRGYDVNGNPIPNIPGSGPKYIPIKIVGITFRITSAGTIYTVTAVPFAHSPLQNQHDAFIQDNISIEGQTFEELIESLFSYLNRNEQSIAEQQSRSPDRYGFVIHDEDLRTSRVGFEHITDGDVISVETQTMGPPSERREYIQISAGSTLKSAIQAISTATDFGARFNTVGQPESEAGNENRPLRVLKIIPVVAGLREYNTSTNRYARDIVYRIENQRMYGFVLPDMPGARPTERGWEKEYNWIFTGKNQDILNFEAEYNVQYYNIRNVFTEAKGRVLGTPSAPGAPLPDDGLTRTKAGDVYSPAIVPKSSPQTASVSNSYRGAAHQLASDHMDNVLNNPGADMVKVDLTIIGDPDWIPQDRSILPQLSAGSGDARIINGSIATDVHDVFVMLKFKTPRDYNPEKGLMRIDTDHTFVQGLYRVITVDNNFYDGKFEQTLKLIRVQDQVSNDSQNLPDLTDTTQIGDTDATDTGVVLREFGTFNPDGTIAGSGQAARPGNFRPSPQVTVEDTRPAVQQLADPDGDGNADDPEAQIFLDPSISNRTPNIIDTISPSVPISDITGEVP